MFTWKKFLLITVAAAVVGIGSAFGWSYYQATPKRLTLPLPPWTARSLNFLTCAAKPCL